MQSMAIPTTAMLTLSTLTHAGPARRWRNEAMRSHHTARLIHVTKGQGRITVAGLTIGYGPNNLIYIPPDTMYGLEVGPMVFGHVLSFSSSPDWPEEPFHLRLLAVDAQKEAVAHLEAIERELLPAGDTRAAACHFGLLSIFVERQLRQRPETETDRRQASAAARLVARYTAMIARDFGSDRNVADYAEALGVTTTHLTRCCRKTCDRSALELLNERVHYEACLLLKETAAPVQKIAADLGFHSPAYFTRRFQELAGTTPTEFRKAERAAPPLKTGQNARV